MVKRFWNERVAFCFSTLIFMRLKKKSFDKGWSITVFKTTLLDADVISKSHLHTVKSSHFPREFFTSSRLNLNWGHATVSTSFECKNQWRDTGPSEAINVKCCAADFCFGNLKEYISEWHWVILTLLSRLLRISMCLMSLIVIKHNAKACFPTHRLFKGGLPLRGTFQLQELLL